MRSTPHWGEPPELLLERLVEDTTPSYVEIRRGEPRHLVECFGAREIRCDTADEIGFLHPGVEFFFEALRAIAPRCDALFAGSIFEVIPYSEEELPGRRTSRVQLVDCYRFGDVDLRNEPFSVRRLLIEELVSAFASPRISLAPILPARASDGLRAQMTVQDTLRLVAR